MIKPYLKIGDKYFLKTGICNELPFEEGDLYITNQFDINHFSNDRVEFIPCLTKGKPLGDFLSHYPRRSNLEILHKRVMAHYKTIMTIKMSLNVAHKFVPASLWQAFNVELLEAMKYASEAIPRAPDYAHQRYAWAMSEIISRTPLNHGGKWRRVLYNAHPSNGYGRYGLQEGSFPILSCSKDERKKIAPISEDHVLVEFDFNAFEIRTLLALCNIDQPNEDLYGILHIKQDHLTRTEFKQNLIASLYSNRPERTPLNSIIQKRHLKRRFPLIDGVVVNPFGKKMESDNYHYYSRLLQSTAAYILFQQMYVLQMYLINNKSKSNIAFCIHDSVCMNVHKDELNLVPEFRNILSLVKIKNYDGKFMMKMKIGKTYETMEIVND